MAIERKIYLIHFMINVNLKFFSCKANEEETYPGSSTTDRRCKKKEITQTTTVAPPVMSK